MKHGSERRPGGAPHARRNACQALRRASLALLLVAISIAFAARAHAGAWTREPGGWFVKLGYDRWFSDERYAADGKRIAFDEPRAGFDDKAEYRIHALRTYVEHGYDAAWTITASTAFETMESEARGATDRTLGVSDMTFQLKRRSPKPSCRPATTAREAPRSEPVRPTLAGAFWRAARSVSCT